MNIYRFLKTVQTPWRDEIPAGAKRCRWCRRPYWKAKVRDGKECCPYCGRVVGKAR
jgi:hypothetical protein